MPPRIKITLRQSAIKRVQIETANRTTRRAADTTKDRVQQNMRKKGRVKTGQMLASVRVMPLELGTHTRYRVYSDLDYTIYQENGVSSVHARPGGRLRFMGRAGLFVFPKSTKGFRAGNFFRDARQDIKVQDFEGLGKR